MRTRFAIASLCAAACCAAVAQQNEPAQPASQNEPAAPAPPQDGFKARTNGQTQPGTYQVAAGTHILLDMINSVSTKQAAVGDRIYLETAFPVLSDGKIVIPQGSWVTGTITEVKRPGRMKGRGALQVRFDSLTLPNGVNRNFRSDLGAIDARDDQTLKREESTIGSKGGKKDDLGTIVGSTAAGTVIGSGIGAAAGNAGKGAGIGTGAGAAAGLLGVLFSRGPDATLTKGSTVEMVLDRPLTFAPTDLDFGNAPAHAPLSDGGSHQPAQQRGWPQRSPF
jgi:type IV secretion system protein VirB10